MNKAEYKFYRDKKEQIENNSKESDKPFYYRCAPANSPIFIPKRKKKK